MEKRSKVFLFVSSYDRTGGAETQAQLFSTGLAQAGYDVMVITRLIPGCKRRQPAKGVVVKRTFVFGGRHLKGLLYIMQGFFWAIRWGVRGEVKLIYALQCESPMILAWMVKQVFRKAILLISVAGGDWQLIKTSPIRQYFIRQTDYLRVPNPSIRDEARKIIEDRKIWLNPSGIDLNLFRPPLAGDKEIRRQALGIPSSAKVFIYVGRLEKIKGVDLLLESWIAFRNNGHKNVYLIIIGSGSLERMVLSYTKEGVRFLGEKSPREVADILGVADAFVSPSRQDAGPFTILEAMAKGLPIIATAVGFAPDIFDKANVGFLAQPNDRQSLVEGFEFFVKLPESEAVLMGKRGREIVQKWYDLESTIQEHIKKLNRE